MEALQSGDGPPAALAHGDALGAHPAWAAQDGLARRFTLRTVSRRGCGGSPSAPDQTFMVDADDVAEALENGARLMGHSSGGAAARTFAASPDGMKTSPPGATLRNLFFRNTWSRSQLQGIPLPRISPPPLPRFADLR
ncbi:alpha/beta hydrolase [Streptomyces sp. NPDC001904]|uniref:alpha/beta fold hydrolase n=1 Tax=Streptomyces sp. NPDC001904 TaxID=3154531 RepID=UPI00332A3BA5